VAKIEIEIPDDGKVPDDFLARLPDPLKKFTDTLSDRVFKEGYAKGMAKKADDLKPHLVDPAERERQAAASAELEELKARELEREKKYEEARALRETAHKKDLEKTQAEIARRDARLRKSIRADIQSAALKAGARDESLDELSAILGGEIDLDDALEPYVKGADGKPAVDDTQQRVTIEGRVRAYLDGHRHHLKSNLGSGGGASGGKSFAHLTGKAQDAARAVVALEEQIAKEGASDALVGRLFEAQRAARAAQAGA
jgi:hypothetical protein